MTRSLVLFVLVLAGYHPALGQPPPRDAHGLTAYRPQHGTGYAPFARTAVPEEFEEHPRLGPGIRVNRADEADIASEDDLIELVVTRPSTGTTFVFERSHISLSVWETREKRAQTALAFSGGRSTELAFDQASQITVWVEWTSTAPEFPVLSLRSVESEVVVDRIVFHAFTSLVVALGGEGQVPKFPVGMSHGTYQVATALYEVGYDVLMRDEDEVGPNGSGSVYEEVVNAVQKRSVRELAIFGYSHGGGSTYDLCERLTASRARIGTFSINFTSYVDAIQNGADIDHRAEQRKPPTTGFHANHYQRSDWILRGRPVVGSSPPPTGLQVDTVAWGSGVDHYSIDDLEEVRNFIHTQVTARVSR